MAGPYYVRSTDGNDADSGLTWALAKATLAGALAVAAAGERIWVSQVHAESQASLLTLVSNGTLAAPVEVFCGNDASEPPTTLAVGATISTTGANDIVIGTGDRKTIFFGLTFNCGTSGVRDFAIGDGKTIAIQCTFSVGGDSNGGISCFNPSLFIDCAFVFSHVGQALLAGSNVEMQGGSVGLTGAVPTSAFLHSAGGQKRFRGVDFSAFGSGKSLVDVSSISIAHAEYRFEQCRIGSFVSLTTGANGGHCLVFLDNCDSAATQYRMQRHSPEGDVYSETVVVHVRPRPSGAQPLSHKMVSANSNFHAPLYGPEMARQLTAGSPKTLRVEILHDSVTPLTDGEVWLEVEYLGVSGVPSSLFASDRKADVLATAANQTLSVVDWVTTGITNVMKQKLEVTVTPQMVGWVRCRVALAKASYTIFVDPRIVVS